MEIMKVIFPKSDFQLLNCKTIVLFLKYNLKQYWKDFIIEKYSYTGDRKVKSFLWNDILKLRHTIQLSTTWLISNGESIRFWLHA